MDSQELNGTEIAIVGMAGRFPQSADINHFWQNIRNGTECVQPIPLADAQAQTSRPGLVTDPNFVPMSSAAPDYDKFDAAFFDYSPRDAEIMDPQQRIFLESCWTALEHAGYDPAQTDGPVGVFGGGTTSSYLIYNLATSRDQLRGIDQGQLDIGNGSDFISTRVSYKLNLMGPSFSVQTACSTSLVAVHLASQALLSDECDMALAGGVCVHVDHDKGYQFVEGSILSPDGKTRAFDAEANGTVFSSGVGVVVLKRLEDALRDRDHVHAVILGSAMNNDGSDRVGFPAPGVEGQAGVVAEAIAVADVDVETINYVEAHGSGTKLGDPIEMRALTKAFRQYSDATDFCKIGSVKTNVGHLTGASGIAGLLKTVLALENAEMPPTLNFESPNPQINFEASPFRPNTHLTPWARNGTPRRAGVSSFGLGGTNAHVVLEEAPQPAPSSSGRASYVIPLSAKTASALDTLTQNLHNHLLAHPDQPLADIAYTLQRGRQPMTYRRAIVCATRAELLEKLSQGRHDGDSVIQVVRSRPVAFVFGADGVATDRHQQLLASEPAYRNAYGTGTHHAFNSQYALATLWQSWGITPQLVTGTGVGELVAACVSGSLTLADAQQLLHNPLATPTLAAPSCAWFSTISNGWVDVSTPPNLQSWQHGSSLDAALAELRADDSRLLLRFDAAQYGDNEHAATDTTATLTQLWLADCRPNWADYYQHEQRQRLVLPTYPFERKRFWIDPGTDPIGAVTAGKQADISSWFYTHSWRSLPRTRQQPQLDGSWHIHANGSQLCTDLQTALKGHANGQSDADQIVYFADTRDAATCLSELFDFVNKLDGQPRQLTLVTQHSLAVLPSEQPNPQAHALLAAVQTIPQEFPHITCRLIDCADTDAAALLATVGNSAENTITALRHNQRWARTATAAPFNDDAPPLNTLQADGVYLIIGGLSDIGLELASVIANDVQPTLLIVDDRQDDEALASLKKTGADVLFAKVDWQQSEQIKQALAMLVERFDRITAIIHAPSLPPTDLFQPIATTTRAAIDAHFAAKLDTLNAVRDLANKHTPEYVILCSALSTVLGGVGFATFTAAAHVYNAVAQCEDGDTRWLSINWEFWDAAGLPENIKPYAINSAEAHTVLSSALANASDPIVIISSGDLAQRQSQFASRQSPSAATHERPEIWTDYVAPRDKTEERIVAIWQQVLGIEQIGINDNFFDLGGHSLLATQLRNHLHEQFGVELSLQLLFDNPTVALTSVAMQAEIENRANTISLSEQLQSAFIHERPAVLRRFIRDKFATSLSLPADEINDDLSGYDMQLPAVDLIWHLKRELNVQFYPHEILGEKSITALADFLLHHKQRMDNLPSYATDLPLSAYRVRDQRAEKGVYLKKPDQQNAPMAFLLSGPRSGSTLLRVMLAGHPQIFCPPEISLLFFHDMQEWQQNVAFGQDFTWPAEGLHFALVELMGLEPQEGWDLIERWVQENRTVQYVYQQIQDRAGSQLVIDKTPPYAMDPTSLQRAELMFNRPKYIHLTRHPYAMMESFLRVRLDQQFSSSLFDVVNPDPYIVAETIWQTANTNLANFMDSVDSDRHIFVRYEDVVGQQEETLGRLCDFLELPYDPLVLTPYDGRKERMMGGIGDPNILNHTGVDPKLGDVWRSVTLPRPLDPTTVALATRFGYELPNNVVIPDRRVEHDPTPEIDVDALSDEQVAAMLEQLMAGGASK